MLELCTLPYDHSALEPQISARTLQFHHEKHHAGYIAKTNTLAADASLSDRSLEQIIAVARGRSNSLLFNNAAQAWNHAFYWQSMRPKPVDPNGQLNKLILAGFGSADKFRSAFIEQGLGHFGSGWLWLAVDLKGALCLIQTHDAGTLCGDGQSFPLLVCDLWEHAYYLDRQNQRQAYLEAWFDNLANWEFAVSQLKAATTAGTGYQYQESRAALA